MEAVSQADVGSRPPGRRMMEYHSWRVPVSSVAIVLVFVLLFALTAAKPLLLDNTDFPAAAKRTAETGVPVYYRGEDNPAALGLYHPPLYIYSLAAWMRVFGPSEASVRMFGFICALLQGLIVLEILRTLFGREFWRRSMAWFWALFLLNPYTVQTAGIADIDSTVYGPVLCLALLVLIRMNWDDGIWKATQPRASDYLLLSLALTLCLWAKLTTVFLVFPFVFIFLLHRLGVWRSLVAMLAVTVISCSAFYVTYWCYGKLTGLDVNFTYAFTWMSFVVRGTSGTPGLAARLSDFRRNFAFMGPFMVAWTGLLPWVAAVCALIWAGARAIRLRDRRAFHYAALLTLAVLTTLYYCAKTITFGGAPFRYTFVYWALVITAILVPILRAFDSPAAASVPRELSRRASFLGAAALLVIIPFMDGLRIRDVIITSSPHALKSLHVLLPAVVFGLAFAALRYNSTRYRIIMMATLLAFVGLQTGVALYQAKADYATTYDYGETGFTDAVGFIRTQTASTDVIACMKDIGIKSGRRFVETYSGLYGDAAASDRLIHSIADGTVRYAIFTEAHGQDQLVINPRVRTWVLDNCTLVRSIGDYRVYQYKPDIVEP